MKRKNFTDPHNYVNEYGRDRPRWQWFFDQGVGPVIDPSPWVKQKGDVFTDNETLMMTNDYFICPEFKHPQYKLWRGFSTQSLKQEQPNRPLAGYILIILS